MLDEQVTNNVSARFLSYNIVSQSALPNLPFLAATKQL